MMSGTVRTFVGLSVFSFPLTRGTPAPTLFPYTTLFRSSANGEEFEVAGRQSLGLEEQVTQILVAAPAIDEHLRYLLDRKSTRLNSSHVASSYAVLCSKQNRGRVVEESMAQFTSGIPVRY